MSTDTADIDRRIIEAREGLRDLYAERASIRKAAREKDKYGYIPELRQRALLLYKAGHSTRYIAQELNRHPATISTYVREEAEILAQSRVKLSRPERSEDRFNEMWQIANEIEAEWKAIRKANKQKLREPA